MVKKNKYGFYELKNKPSANQLLTFYTKQYYRQKRGNYSNSYSKQEVNYFRLRIERKYWVIDNYLSKKSTKRSILDVGCGEGWALKYFGNKKWYVKGIDFDNSSCVRHNPKQVKHIAVGDVYSRLTELIVNKEYFDVIWMDHLLEHVINPGKLLTLSRKLIKKNGILVIEVPNDFSPLQRHLLKSGYINSRYWISKPDHISYFNRDGLINICGLNKWKLLKTMADFPIDINLLNKNTNYIATKNKGKSCHFARIEFENLLNNQSIGKTIEFYTILSELGLGREIICFLIPK